MLVLVEHGYQFCCELLLTFVGKGIACFLIAHLVMIATARFHYHDLLVREINLQLCQSFVEIADGTFIIWIVGCADDVVVHLVGLDAIEERYIKRRVVGTLLCMDDDFGLRTYLATGFASILKCL